MNNHKKALRILALLSLAAMSASAHPAVDLTGTWRGSYDTGDSTADEITLVLKKADKSYAGTINDSLGYIEKDTAIADVVLAGNEFSFSFKAMGGSMEFAMKLTVNGDKMTGELSNVAQGRGVPFEFVRKK